MFLYSYALGIILGLSLAGPPGSVNSIIANESLKSRLHGMGVGFGAMTADLTFFFIVYITNGIISPVILKIIYIAGGAFMLYLGFSVMRSRMPSKTRKGNYFLGLTMGLTNPFQIIWWFTAGFFLLKELSIFSVTGLFSGIIIWIFIFPYVVWRFGTGYEKYIKIISAAIIFGFAIYILYAGTLLIIK
ncbi:MAG: LysE family translocator [Ferroplasma sp.]|uniref:LysE family translocator n=1 Tax=Ferroplasma sp. TaxID=2591003 RepID=UPI0028158FF4|nr:LysE family translocator [Ferroplasma sp.]WMT51669.1 MAG: LysE family translocator [Ferroplasma sp.]